MNYFYGKSFVCVAVQNELMIAVIASDFLTISRNQFSSYCKLECGTQHNYKSDNEKPIKT